MTTRAMDLGTVSDTGLVNWDATPFLKKVTDIAPGIIYIFNQETQSNEYSNRSLGVTLGFSEEEVIEMGQNMIPMLCHPDDLQRVIAHFGKIGTLKDGEVARVDYRMRHKNGDWAWLVSHDTVFDRSADGKVLRHVGVATDITAQKEAEERAIAEKLKATTTNDELRAFSYSMSHDMKAPSNTLHLLLTELLETHRDSLDPDAIELLDMSLLTVNRMGGLVDDVLNYTRVIDRDLTVEAVPLGPLIRDCLADLHALVQEADAEIEVSDLPVIQADRMQMRILFQNLIENALKFREPGKPARIKIFADTSLEWETRCITVADSGIGIDPTKHEKIFQIFKRLNAAFEFTGSGLGLAICRRIAANHGSTITVESKKGKGSAFTVELSKV